MIRDFSAKLGYPVNGKQSELTKATSEFLKARENEPDIVNNFAHPEKLGRFASAFCNEYYDPHEKTKSNAEHFWGVNNGSRGRLLWPQDSDKIMEWVCHIFRGQRNGRITSGRLKAHKEQLKNLGQLVPQEDQVSDDYDSNVLSDPEVIPRGTLSRPYRPDVESGPMFQPQMTEFTSHDGFPGDFRVFGEEIPHCPLRSGALLMNGLHPLNTTSTERQSTSITYNVSDDDQPIYQPGESSFTVQHEKRRKLNRSINNHGPQFDLVGNSLRSDTATTYENLPTSPQPDHSSPSGTAPPHQITPMVGVSYPAQMQQAFAGEFLPHNSMPFDSPYQPRTSFGQANPVTSISSSANFPETPLQSISSGQGSLELGTVIEGNIQHLQGTQRSASIQHTISPQADNSTSNVPHPDSRAEQTEIETQPAHVAAATKSSQQGLSVDGAESCETHWLTPDVPRLQTGSGETTESPVVLDDLPISNPCREQEPELAPIVKSKFTIPSVLAEIAIEDAEEISDAQVALVFQFLVYDTSDGRFKKNHTEYNISELPDNFDFETSTIPEFFKFYESEEVSRAPEPLISLQFTFPVELRSRYICSVINSSAHERDFKGIKDQILEALRDWATHYPGSDSMIIEVVIPGWQPPPPMNARKAVPGKLSYKALGKSKVP